MLALERWASEISQDALNKVLRAPEVSARLQELINLRECQMRSHLRNSLQNSGEMMSGLSRLQRCLRRMSCAADRPTFVPGPY